MIYPFLTLDDDTEIVHTEILKDGSVKVRAETPVFDGFNYMVVYLPSYKIFEVHNYTYDEFEKYMAVIRDSEKLIMHFAAHGGFENAPPFQKLRQKELLRRGKNILAK